MPRSLLIIIGIGIAIAVFFSPWKAVSTVLLCASIILACKKPEYLIYGLLAYIPFEPFLLKFIPNEIYVYARYFPEGLIYLLCAVCITRVFVAHQSIRIASFTIPFLLFIFTAIISAIVHHTPFFVASLGIRQSVRFVLCALIIVMLKPTRQIVRNVCCIVIGIAFFESGVGILQAIVGQPMDTFLLPAQRKLFGDIQLMGGVHQFWETGQRVFATMGRYDQLGTFLSLTLLLITAMLYEYKKSLFFKYLLGIFCVGIITLVLTYSRASWFGFLLGGILIAIAIKRDTRVITATAIGALMIAGYLFYSGIVVKNLIDVPRQTVAHRFFEAFSLERWRGEYYGLGRMFFFVQTPFVVVASSPLIGVGPGTYGGGTASALHYTESYEKLGLPFGIKGTEGYIDNNWFSLWGETGTIGLFAYASMIFLCVLSAWKVYTTSHDPLFRSVSLGFIGIACAVTLQAFLATYLEMRTLALYFWIFAGIVASEHLRMEEKNI